MRLSRHCWNYYKSRRRVLSFVDTASNCYCNLSIHYAPNVHSSIGVDRVFAQQNNCFRTETYDLHLNKYFLLTAGKQEMIYYLRLYRLTVYAFGMEQESERAI